jgi:hypothetical protein
MDESGSLYATDEVQHEVRQYRRGESEGTVVAGGNGRGNRADQLSSPKYVFVDRDHSVYVSDYGNHRVMKWVEGAKQGIVVAGGQGEGNSRALSTWLKKGIIESRVGSKERHKAVSLLVETVEEDNRTNSVCPYVCHSIDMVIFMSLIGEMLEYKNSISTIQVTNSI